MAQKKFNTTSTGIDVTGTAAADNLHINSTSGQLKISRVGSSDNGIYWDRLGTQDAAIQVASNEQLNIDNNFGNPINLRIGADGSETTHLSVNSSGIDVTGNNLDHTALSPQYNMIESDITGNNTQFLQVGGDLRIRTIDDSKANPVERLRIDHALGDISFYDDTGSTQGLFWDASAEQLLLGITATAAGGSLVAKTDSNGYGIAIEENSGSERWSLGVDVDGDLNFLNSTDTTPTVTFNDAGKVGIGTASPSVPLHISNSAPDLRLQDSDGTEQYVQLRSTNGNMYLGARNNTANGTLLFGGYGGGSFDEHMRIDTSGKVGIGTASPSRTLHIKDAVAGIRLEDSDGTSYGEIIYNEGSNGLLIRSDENNADSGSNIIFEVDGAESSRIDSSGNLLVGKTAASSASIGFQAGQSGFTAITRASAQPLVLNRTTNDGIIAEFKKDSTQVGNIGTSATDLFIGTGVAGLRFREAGSQLMPWNTTTNAANDSAIDIGKSDAKFKDLYLSGTANFGSLSDGTITITGFVDQDNMSSDSPTLLPTQQSVKAYVDANSFTINNNADNRIITGTATAGTLNAETTLTYGTTGADLAITGGSIGGVPPILRLEDVGSSGKLAELNHITGTTTLTSRNATSNGVIKFAGHNGTSETEYARITSSGNVGIKNSNPTGTLTVGTLSSGQTGNVVINNEGGNTATLEVLSRTNRSILKIADNDTTGYISAENGLFSIGRNTGNNSANININSSNNGCWNWYKFAKFYFRNFKI